MIVVLHKHKIAHGKRVGFTYMYICCRKTHGQLQYHQNVYFCKKLEDIQMLLQLSECLSATNLCEQITFPTRNFMFMQPNRNSDKISLNLKTWKSINLRTMHIYMDTL